MSDLAGFRAEVLSRLGLPTDDTMAATADLDKAINAALAEYAVEGDWPWLQTEVTINTVSGTPTSPLPTRFVRALYARIGDEELLPRSYNEMIQYANDTDQPRYFTGTTGLIRWVPTPNAVYAVVFGYVQNEVPLVGTTDTPLLPSPYHDYLTVKAARKMAERLRDGPLLQMLRASEAEWMAKLKADQRRTAGLGRVRAFFRGV